MGQAAFCSCFAASPPVNGFYKDMTTLHILAMSLTFPTALLLQVMPVPLGTVWPDHPDSYILFDGDYSRAASDDDNGRYGAISADMGAYNRTYPTAASYAFLSLVIFFSLHSVGNCCRVIFDACGERAAKFAVIPAALCQMWLLWPPLTFTFSLQMVMLILIAIDYCQHLVSCAYWAAVACRATSASRRGRALYGVCGGLFHMLSAVPLVSFHVVTSYQFFETTERPGPWVCVPLVGLAVGLMASAQTCWINMALLTPQASAATRLAMVHEPRGSGRRAPSPQLPRAAPRKQRQRQSERSYHPEHRTVQSSSTADDMELAAGEASELAAALRASMSTCERSQDERSFVHTDFTLPQTTPDYIPIYPADLVVVHGAPPPPPPAPPPAPLPAPPDEEPAPLPAQPGGEVDVWAEAHTEEDVWAEAQTDQGETYYYHLVTGEASWERHYVL